LKGRANLSDCENYYFGGSSFLRNYAITLRGPSSSLAAFDIYSFGHVVFEMATGFPLEAPVCDGKLPQDLPDILSKSIIILCCIYSSDVKTQLTIL